MLFRLHRRHRHHRPPSFALSFRSRKHKLPEERGQMIGSQEFETISTSIDMTTGSAHNYRGINNAGIMRETGFEIHKVSTC